MKRFIVELGVVPSALDPFVIYCDNMGAIANAQEPRSHKRLKHIKLRYHSIREYIEDGEVQSSDVDSDDESFHTKTRHVLRRLQSGHYDGPFAQGIYKCPFCNRKLRATDFNSLVNHAESIGKPAKTYFKVKSLGMTRGYWRNSTCAA
ncbi:hypothetical protein QYE76_041829 [Lolium multiflorum]|uniref:Retrovirus-related Pol polyprotein from transposon TNT 1-94 n=1 Tax=Lolium multiflorum TaxID=4521 RepID=A0AAD8TG47_LOLMU|nr:hypothetical protein QYE76_041829 [Lolium multiflorum]